MTSQRPARHRRALVQRSGAVQSSVLVHGMPSGTSDVASAPLSTSASAIASRRASLLPSPPSNTGSPPAAHEVSPVNIPIRTPRHTERIDDLPAERMKESMLSHTLVAQGFIADARRSIRQKTAAQ